MTTDVYKIRDGIDIYLVGEELLTVYFMNTRRRGEFKVNPLSVSLIEAINGIESIGTIKNKLERRFGKEIELTALQKILSYLQKKGIIVDNNEDLYQGYITTEEREQYDRQLNFFGDFLAGPMKKYEVQQKIRDAKILMFGCGAVGGWIATQLAMCGVRNFLLFDGDSVETSDISRHVFFKQKHVGIPKVKALAEFLKEISNDIQITEHIEMLNPTTSISNLIQDSDFVINTADEPYIGHTSLKISRECVNLRKAHYIAGGFDAHLASTGEIIIPGVTPCVDCYTGHFNTVLKDWKPEPHPVIERYLEIGGLSSMSLFSSSYAVIEIIKFLGQLVDFSIASKTRGEFLFDSMTISYLDVEKKPTCKTCGGVNYDEA
ncbi:ThiF family adenylyltransferase [Brevibacillus brevis]|nr:ThiF family adenylyltransferase [Brevibacillus brevis]